MKRCLLVLTCAMLLMLMVTWTSLATTYWSAVNISSLPAGTQFDLEFQLFGGGSLFNAEVLLDNILLDDAFGDTIVDFEDGSLGGFQMDSWNAPGTVRNAAGNLNGTGSKVMSMIEDPTGGAFTTIAYRTFEVPIAPTELRFDYKTLGFEAGDYPDQFTAWIRGTSGEALLIPGVAYEQDPVVMEVTNTYGTQTNPYVTTTQGTDQPVPEPATILLMVSGLGGIVAYGRKRRTKQG